MQYAYTEMSGGQNNSRLTSMTYPSGYVVNYNYNAGLDTSISRLTSLSDSGGTLESYKYLGLGTVVERDHPQTGVNLTYISQTGGTGDAGDQYTGLDRFGRVVDQNWYDTNTASSTDDFQYSYDRDSNVLSRQNALDSIFSESYGYDNLNQLTSFTRSTHTQSWTPDALGNFTQVTTDGTTQTRTANQQNEITSISGQGAVTYDANGNLTADGSGNTYVYDAWNRLVAVKNGGATVASYAYNGLGERITETHGATTTDLYYSSSWQVLEERVNGQLQARNVWSPVYVNALVLRDQSSQQNGVLDQRLYVQQDANWNVTALVDINGNVVERYLTDPYGAVTVLTPTWGTRGASAYGWLYFLQGERFDLGLGDFHGRVWSVTLQRFLQVDPLGLGPDNNDYRGEGDNPIDTRDPSGLWKIERDGDMRAIATAEKADTIQGLADIIGLDAGEAGKWLRPKSSDLNLNFADGSQEFWTKMDRVTDVALRAGEKFEIPNTVIMLWTGEFGVHGRIFSGWSGDKHYLLQRGFRVEEVLVDDSKPAPGFDELRKHLQPDWESGSLQGIYDIGHGLPWSLCVHNGDGINYSDIEKNYLKYHLALVIINACNGGWSRADVNAAGNITYYCGNKGGKGGYEAGGHDYFGRQTPNPAIKTGPLDAGAKDLAAHSRGRVFYGIKDIFMPQITMQWGSDTVHVTDKLKPGDQGTRP